MYMYWIVQHFCLLHVNIPGEGVLLEIAVLGASTCAIANFEPYFTCGYVQNTKEYSLYSMHGMFCPEAVDQDSISSYQHNFNLQL